MEILIYAITPAMLLGAWITGTIIERRHLKSLLLLESGSREIMVLTIEELPPEWKVEASDLVMGNVVISMDYFKRFAAGLKGLVGGNIKVFEPLLERARREALIRMKAQAHTRGHDTIINVRIETSPMARSRGDGKGTSGVEIIAFGTAITLGEGGRALLTA